ncbi:MAG: hypothetical protein IMZ61_10765 [Planctomycetes bacterium]|nr:hypothetical protein [Planctomycetota bacterium]
MPRYKRFTFLLTPNERMLIYDLAIALKRSQGDAVRFVVLQELERLGLLLPPEETRQAAVKTSAEVRQ